MADRKGPRTRQEIARLEPPAEQRHRLGLLHGDVDAREHSAVHAREGHEVAVRVHHGDVARHAHAVGLLDGRLHDRVGLLGGNDGGAAGGVLEGMGSIALVWDFEGLFFFLFFSLFQQLGLNDPGKGGVGQKRTCATTLPAKAINAERLKKCILGSGEGVDRGEAGKWIRKERLWSTKDEQLDNE